MDGSRVRRRARGEVYLGRLAGTDAAEIRLDDVGAEHERIAGGHAHQILGLGNERTFIGSVGDDDPRFRRAKVGRHEPTPRQLQRTAGIALFLWSLRRAEQSLRPGERCLALLRDEDYEDLPLAHAIAVRHAKLAQDALERRADLLLRERVGSPLPADGQRESRALDGSDLHGRAGIRRRRVGRMWTGVRSFRWICRTRASQRGYP